MKKYSILLSCVAFAVISICISGVAFAQNKFYLETIPVFDGGRTMPLSSFAQQIVFEICGTTRPFFSQDTTVIAELDRIAENQRLLETVVPVADDSKNHENTVSIVPDIRSMDTGLGVVADTLRNARHNVETNRTERIPYMTGKQARLIAERIRTLIPPQGRYFDASELLLSWIIEPEIWDFIPIISVPETEYRQMQGFPLINNTGRTLTHVTIFQLKSSANFKQRHFELAQKQQNPTNPDLSESDKITERILTALYTYENLTFDPRRHDPDRMIEILQNAVPKSFEIAGYAWNWLREIGDNPDNLSRTNEQQEPNHPTSKRWNEIYVALKQLTENFENNTNSERRRIPNLNTVELRFEKILTLLEANIAESDSFMRQIYPQKNSAANTPSNLSADSNSLNSPVAGKSNIKPETILPRLFDRQVLAANEDEIRKHILAYDYSLKSLYREVEAAYVAFYDNGRTLRIMPIISAQTLSDVDTEYAVNPWASIRLVLSGGEHAIRRFIDSDFKSPKLPAQQEISGDGSLPDKINDANAEPKQPIEDIPSVSGMLSSVPRQPSNKPETTPPETSDDNKTETKTENQNNNTKTETDVAEIVEAIDIFDGADEDIYSRPSFAEFDNNTNVFTEPVISLRLAVLDNLYSIFITPTRAGAAAQFQQVCQSVQNVIRECALRVEVRRLKLVEADDQLSAEMLSKTRYPVYEEVGMEHFYFSLSPFFWMMILALGAILFGVIAIIAAFWWREITATVNTPTVKKISEEESAIETGNASVAELSGIKSGVRSGVKSGVRSNRSGVRSGVRASETKSGITAAKDAKNNTKVPEEDDANNIMESIVAPVYSSGVSLNYYEDNVSGERLQADKMAVGNVSVWHEESEDYTNSTEEVVLWVGVGFLMFSIIVALIGGMLRAWISGWAPVTNMYETVILMAVSAAVLGIWYTLYPLVQPAISLAWRYTEFPNLSQLGFLFGKGNSSDSANNADANVAGQLGENYVGGNLSGGVYVDGIDHISAKIEGGKRLMVSRQVLLAVPRIILMLITFCFLMWVSYG
ncbi:MAG: hypothetical protein LBL39_02785, partial [Planctomycetaceae bacterium]|nr:hypothetical protein [Planctomycetaceae bacterium]